MEDDDEFGDLYTDVLRNFPLSSATPQQHQSSSTPSPIRRPIDLNLQNDDEEIVHGAPNTSSTTSQQLPTQTLVPAWAEPVPQPIVIGSGDSGRNLIAGGAVEDQEVDEDECLAGGEKNWASDSPEASKPRVLESEDVKLIDKASSDLDYGGKSGIDGKDGVLMERSVNLDAEEVHNSVKFDVEEVQDGIRDDMDSEEPIIPGLSSGPTIHGVSGEPEPGNRENANAAAAIDEEGDDWEDSDSEDDLQIVLNDNTHHGPMAMDSRGGGGAVGSDDEDDEDGDPLVIVADGVDLNHHQTMEEPEWGEDGQPPAGDGERKEMGEAGKVNGGGMGIAPKIGYSSHGYHPFHSQFKYVRPGAAPIPGAATTGPVGPPGQVRPLVNMGPIPGRGRGDWRPIGIKSTPPMQKNFHSGFGMATWGNNALGRGFGGGLEFTLPSHKTIFDIDIDSFEEKPWKHPGVDITDYFNFGLNEESWKDYCKQLEQLRLEATMQSKIRVYESGRTEQEYDPDLPPELAAAAGINDVSAENANLGKTDIGQSDLAKGSARARPPIPTGRAIQVEGGYGERLPSIDTRPPRIRDSDAIIEIVLQESVDNDSSAGNAVPEQADNDPSREDLRGDQVVEEDFPQVDAEYVDSFPPSFNDSKRDLGGRRAPFMNSIRDNVPEGDGILPFPPEVPVQYRPGSRGQTPVYPSGNFVTHDERRTQGRARDRSPHVIPIPTTREKSFPDNQKEESVESMDGKQSPPLSSPATLGAAREPSVEQKDAVDNELVLANGSPGMEREGSLNEITTTGTVKDGNLLHSVKTQKINSRVEQPAVQELDDGEDLKAARSSENSKARSGSSRDYQKWRDSAEEEVMQDGRSTRMGSIKRQLDEDEQSFRRRDRDGRQEMERSHMVLKGREDSYPYRDWDPSSAHHSQMKAEFDRRKDRDSSTGAWQRRDEDPHGRRIRTEDTRKRERVDDMGSRHWGKIRESDRSDKDEHLHSRKHLDNGNWRGPHDKDVGSRHRERDENLKVRYENVDDLHSKRRKDEEHLRRDHADKEEILHGHRENTSRRKRERDDVLDQRRRDDQPRIRENLDDHHSIRHKDDGWLQRERGEKQRERDERHRLKQSHEESLPKREREEGRGLLRSGRGAEDKAWVSHGKAKDEFKGSEKDYQSKDIGRHSELLKRRDRLEDESLSHHRGREDVYARGNQFTNEERRSRQERSSTRSDRAVNASDSQRVHERKNKENTRKNKESVAVDHNALGTSKRNQEDHSGHINETVSLRGTNEQGNGEHVIPAHRQSSRKHRDDASSDEELLDSRRGRSKLERWTSHKERDYSINNKLTTSLKIKEIDRNNSGGSSLASKLPVDSANTVDPVDNQHHFVEEKDAGDMEIKDADSKPMEDRHMDTVAKLKKRSERFKLPMPSEKEAVAIKKMESEALPSAQSETPADTEIKPERPARKRRWINN